MIIRGLAVTNITSMDQLHNIATICEGKECTATGCNDIINEDNPTIAYDDGYNTDFMWNWDKNIPSNLTSMDYGEFISKYDTQIVLDI